MIVVGLREAKRQLSRLVDRAAAGEEIAIGRAGRPLARLVPYREQPAERRPGCWTGQVHIADDLDDAPGWLPETFEGS